MINFGFKKYNSMPIEAKASLAYTICSILQRALGLITMPLFTRMLSTEQYGQLTVYESWMGIFTILITLNLPYGSFSKVMVKYEGRRLEYVNTVNIISVAMACLFGLIYVFLYDVIKAWIDIPLYLIVIMIVQIISECALQSWYSYKRFEYKYKSVVVVTMLVSILAPVIAYIGVKSAHEKGLARIIGYAVITIAVGMVLLIYNLIKSRQIPCRDLIKYAMAFNVPLIPYYLSQTIFNQSDRIMIDWYCGADKAAIYGVAYTIAMLLTFVLTSINGAYVPWLYQQFKNDNAKANKKLSVCISALMAIMLLAVIWVAPEIIYIIAGTIYADAVWIVPPVAMSLLLLAYTQQFVNIEFYFEEKRMLVFASIGAAIVNIISNAILIPKFDYYVAGYTTLVSYVIFCIMNYVVVHKYVKKGAKLEGAFSIPAMTLIFVILIVLSIVGVSLYDYFVARIGIMLIVGIFLLVKYKDIVALIK